ncbi:MAG TPA: hypothetical protein VHW23_47550 [Kofleriaceae bacterium]|nr:hypothetical protein [Kofleriaceae bacterium]
MLELLRIARIAAFALAGLAAACGHPASQSAEPPADRGPAPVTPTPGAAAGDPPGGPPGTPHGNELCDPAECGPAMRMPSRRCPDGSTGGPTGRCLRKPDGKCGWEVRSCPPG